MREIKLQDLKSKTPAELVSFAEEHGVVFTKMLCWPPKPVVRFT